MFDMDKFIKKIDDVKNNLEKLKNCDNRLEAIEILAASEMLDIVIDEYNKILQKHLNS
ncbi:Spo0E family sporulation regulatory protein-aspartic acid phosphatase [Caldisalinibacter kiritimatiensis]|uniref:Spo0E like sporulation regulatory protein n=1 Tax=Caldisalinibacter kiritimatiensis TaxID=1304284 RepID=R1CYC8_9FIRM|nr:Spo0E family sporulation regulatory protein-aspartic acid phosphatase [Caldisalinibacter kiritimatiensis]EOD01579.1 hypothetical protein L21TH_0318 [Caldisalinibacter kiritimatiensis]